MARNILLFAALFFTALLSGAAFVVWLMYNPVGVSSTFYVEEMQHAIRVATVPLPIVVGLGVLFTVASTFLATRDRPSFYFLVAASICVIGVALITVRGNVPINNQIMTWTINSPPVNWMEVAEKWWRFQCGRTILAIAGLIFLIVSVQVRRDMSQEST